MAKGCYIGVDNVARKVKKGYIGVNGVARKIKKVYIGVDGVAQLCWSNASAIVTIQNYSISGGSIRYTNESGNEVSVELESCTLKVAIGGTIRIITDGRYEIYDAYSDGDVVTDNFAWVGDGQIADFTVNGNGTIYLA